MPQLSGDTGHPTVTRIRYGVKSSALGAVQSAIVSIGAALYGGAYLFNVPRAPTLAMNRSLASLKAIATGELMPFVVGPPPAFRCTAK